jgi:glutamate carboxypeptidase
MPDYLGYFREHHDEMLAFLARMVEHESPTTDKAAVDRYGDFLADAYRALGATVEAIPQADYGDHRRVTLDPPRGAAEGGQITALCHLDTVWAVGELARQPIRTEEGRMYGPGIYDMKGGTMMVLFALRALREQGLAPGRRVVVLLTSEEEIGSPTSRALIEEEARKSAAVLCLEPPVAPDGSLKTARKGVGRFTLKVGGRAAHAGADHAKGISAIAELAHQTLALGAMTDYALGTTVNVGVVRGGTRANVVPAEAEAEIDLRVATVAEGERVVPAILGLQPVIPGATLTVTGGLNRPPMERTPGIAALFERARALGASFGHTVTEAATGGGSDGQFAAALGIPTLDGLGVNGDGAHALGEHILTDSVPHRAALIAALLHTL